VGTIPNFQVNKQEIPSGMPPTKPLESPTKDEIIVIHVCDEKKKIEKDFK
jgi:hypothetical protein